MNKLLKGFFLDDINQLTNEFRNKAAHPYSIGIDMAKQRQELFLEKFKCIFGKFKTR